MNVDSSALLARWGAPVVVRTEARSRDKYGNVTSTSTDRAVPRALFEPRQQTPRTDPRSPGVATPGTFYFPAGVAVTEDDRVVRGSQVWVVKSVEPWVDAGIVAHVDRWGTS